MKRQSAYTENEKSKKGGEARAAEEKYAIENWW